VNDNPYLMRAIRGPIILITVGSLFALDHFSTVPFDRSWPVLIIVIGLLQLLDRSPRYSPAPPPYGPQQGPPPPPPPPSYPPAPPYAGGNPQ
jgi:hypothetical protein